MGRHSHIVDNAGYGVGALAAASFATVPGLILLYYLTDTLAIPAAIAGVIVFLPKVFDVFFNPLVGRLSDKTKTRIGARRPWILLGGLVFPLAFMATFWTPYSGMAAAIWVGVSFTLASMAFSSFVVPWSSLPAEIAEHSDARTSMASWRIAFMAMAILISGSVAPTIIASASETREGYRLMALAMGGMMILSTLLVFFIGARRSRPETTQPAPAAGFRTSVRMLRSSQPLRAMFWLVILTEIAAAVSLGSTPYVATYVVGEPSMIRTMFVLLTASLFLSMPLWRTMAIRIGKRPALRAALLIYALGTGSKALLAFIPPEFRETFVYASQVVAGIGFAGAAMLPQAMFADALAYEASLSGETNTGAMVGAWNAAETISGGLGAAIFAMVLTWVGFISSSEGEAARQSDAAIAGIALAAGLIPAIAVFLARIPLRKFALSEAKVDRVASEPA